MLDAVTPSMRLAPVSSALAMVACGAFLLACVEEERTPVARPGTTTVVSTQPRPMVNSAPPAQPATPPIVNNNNVIEPPASTVNVAPPAYGATESQADERTRATEMVALASQ